MNRILVTFCIALITIVSLFSFVSSLVCYKCEPSQDQPSDSYCEDIFLPENAYVFSDARKAMLAACPPNAIGCYKRWVDVSGMYTERGCRFRGRVTRQVSPTEPTLHTRRFQELEGGIPTDVTDGCVHSEQATPLDAGGMAADGTYASCVCSRDKCNSAEEQLHVWTERIVTVFIVCVSVFFIYFNY